MLKNCKIYLGPPGTGKTKRIIDLMEEELKNVAPNRIAFLSFTKKAVEEAINRAIERFSFSKSDLIYFKTIHSIAFSSLGIRREQVLQPKDFKKIGDHLGLKFTGGEWHEGAPNFGREQGDSYSFIHGFSRARRMSCEDVWDMVNHDNLNWFEFVRYKQTVEDYKRDQFMYDFADMLELEHGELDIDVLIIDEAQDLSTAQWEYINRVFCKAKRVYIAGDDDQAIYEWSGADVNYFINLPGERTILDRSWRIPKKVHDIAEGISSKIENRTKKDYRSRDEDGVVDYWSGVDDIDMSTGTWLLLARNTYLLNELAVSTRNKGYNFCCKGKNSVSKADIKAIQLWERKRRGHIFNASESKLIDDYTSNQKSDKIWHEAFNLMDWMDKEYYISLLRRGESLTKEPRINISTVHGSKGGEADNVVLLTDMAYSTWNATQLNSDSEHRVWYVGATRCREQLHIVQPRGRYAYDI